MAVDFRDVFGGRTALITGASSGLGMDFARLLAGAGADLVLVARRHDRLEALRDELAGRYADIRIDLVAMDLAGRKAPRALYDEIKGWGRSVDILVNNAGRGQFGWFMEMDWAGQREMMHLDLLVPGELAHLFGRDMVELGTGHMLFVSSLAGYLATPTYAAYAGAKAGVLLLGEALNFELRGTGVTSTVLSPGVTQTEFFEVSGQEPTLYQRIFMMESERVAAIGLKALVRGRASVVPGFWNKLQLFALRLVPRAWAKWVAYATMRNAPDAMRSPGGEAR